MSITQMLLDMRAAFAARTAYARASARLFDLAKIELRKGDEREALRLANLATMVRWDARGEYDR